jgi:hypothetical protein
VVDHVERVIVLIFDMKELLGLLNGEDFSMPVLLCFKNLNQVSASNRKQGHLVVVAA